MVHPATATAATNGCVAGCVRTCNRQAANRDTTPIPAPPFSLPTTASKSAQAFTNHCFYTRCGYVSSHHTYPNKACKFLNIAKTFLLEIGDIMLYG